MVLGGLLILTVIGGSRPAAKSAATLSDFAALSPSAVGRLLARMRITHAVSNSLFLTT